MGRDPRKNSSFESGMRGREKPKVQDAHGGTLGQEATGTDGGEKKQTPMGHIGNPDGVSLNDSAYSSGMRGMETAKQKSAAPGPNSATYGQQREGTSNIDSNTQKAGAQVGRPDGEQSWSSEDRGPKREVSDEHLRSRPEAAHKLGIPGNNTEAASQHKAPVSEEGILGEEDDTHINIRVPKASLKRKNSGLQTN